jgi:acetyltransferase-like isoleucine patch superfamily enzyme
MDGVIDFPPVGRELAVQELLASLPSWAWVQAMRTYYHRKVLASCGRNLRTRHGVIFRYPENIHIGNDVFVNRGALVTARTRIVIGDDVLIGARVIVDSGGHEYRDPAVPIRRQGMAASPITIGDDVWIGMQALILKGVELGRGCVVAAGAVVVESVADYAIVGGVPATVIGHR